MKEITDIQGSFELHNGVQMPYFGLGTYQADNDDEVINSVRYALDLGYRHVDTASAYGNEEGVGKGIRESKVSRDEVFVVSKVWNSEQGYESTLNAFEASLKRLDLDYMDLYLIHWPVKGKYKETWRALERLYQDGRVRAIGVSNFLRHHLEDLSTTSTIAPMVNQMEFHPYLVQQELLDYCSAEKIQYEAWSPFMQGRLFDLDFTKDLCKKYGKSAAQVILRWNLQKGVVTIPKSVNQDRIKANSEIFDFSLTEEDVNFLDGLDREERSGADPDNFSF